MKLDDLDLNVLQQALGYAVVFAKTEAETAEFALMKLEIEGLMIRKNELAKAQAEHDKKGCVFQYCAYTPKCEGKCQNNSETK